MEMAMENLDALLLDGRGGATRVALKKGASLPGSKNFPLWVRLNPQSEEAGAWLNSCDRFDSVVVEHLMEEDSRPRSQPFEEGLLLSLRAVNLNKGRNPQDMIAIMMWLEDGLVITSRAEPLKSFDDLERSLSVGMGPWNSSQFLSRLVDCLADNTELTMDELEDDLEELEENVDLDNMSEMRSQLTDLRRFALRLKRYLTPQREALNHLLSASPKWLKKRDRTLIRENIDQYNRFHDELLFTSERVRVVQEDLQNLAADEVNGRMYALTLAATVFLPLSFFTGLFGINLEGIPWAHSGNGFLYFTLCLCGFVVAQLLLFRWMKLL